eukprot:617287_1
MTLQWLHSVIISCFLLNYTHASCLNHDNEMVNWWFIYRFPKNAVHPDGKQHVFDHEYLYYDATHSDPSKRPKPIHPEPDINPPQVQQPSKKKIKVAKKTSTTKHKSLPKVKPKTKAKPKPKNKNHKAANDDDMDFSTLQDLEELDILSSNIITGKRKRPSTRRRLESLHQKLHQHKRNPLSNTLKQFFEDKKKAINGRNGMQLCIPMIHQDQNDQIHNMRMQKECLHIM